MLSTLIDEQYWPEFNAHLDEMMDQPYLQLLDKALLDTTTAYRFRTAADIILTNYISHRNLCCKVEKGIRLTDKAEIDGVRTISSSEMKDYLFSLKFEDLTSSFISDVCCGYRKVRSQSEDRLIFSSMVKHLALLNLEEQKEYEEFLDKVNALSHSDMEATFNLIQKSINLEFMTKLRRRPL